MRYTFLLLSIMAISIIGLSSSSLNAQHTPSPYRIAIQITDSLAIFSFDEAGTFTPIRDFGSQFGLFGISASEWLIPTSDSISPSPNSQAIAFVAFHDDVIAIFVYNFIHDELLQTTVSGFANLQWAPDSSGLVLIPTDELDSFRPNLTTLAVYELTNNQIKNLTAPDQVTKPVFWSPDSQGIVYTHTVVSCDLPCVDAKDLFYISRDGQNTFQLTDLGNHFIQESEASEYDFVFCGPETGAWSFDESELYFSVVCWDEAEFTHAFLDSVTLAGNGGFEVDLSLIFSTDDYTTVRQLYGLETGVYVVITGQPVIDDIAYSAWRMLQVNDNATHLIYEDLFDLSLSPNLHDYGISPHGAEFVLSGLTISRGTTNSYLVIGDMFGLAEPHVYEPEQHICEVSWINEQELLLVQQSGRDCVPNQLSAEHFSIDTATGDIEPLITPAGLIQVIDVED